MSRSRTFIIPGNLVHLARMQSYLNSDVCGILVHEKIAESDARGSSACPKEFADRLFTLASLVALTTIGLNEPDCRKYDRCIRRVLSDARAHYLATRAQLNTAFNNAILIEKIVFNSISIIGATEPNRLISSSTPHSLEAWVFAQCCEELGIPVYILERTAINNRAWIYRGMDTQKVVPLRADSRSGELTQYTQRQVRDQRETKPGERDAKGFYVSRMDLSSVKGAEANQWWSHRRELSTLFAGRLFPSVMRLASVYLKWRLYRSYRNVAVKRLPLQPFIVFFMHYQPERSSLPEGLFHVQQWTAIRLLANVLPEGWKVLVREHPTTWLLPLDISVRTVDIFKEIASLPNVEVCAMEFDTFEIIDKCAAVATLTGSVGFQALLRGKPVLSFGLPAYKDHPACVPVDCVDNLINAIRTIQCGGMDGRLNEETLTSYLSWVEQNSIAADIEETDWLEARLKNFTELYRQLLCGNLVETESRISLE